ncbi:phage holin family protein [uncultured Gordonia sp.]|uniref:phage holin family protein n=1 Tax=uncultured Gordonia sp. TaxID=198437 RepID=UPI002585B3A4|nr:phage holin family protein [uncultured Gordonia sp.]
MTSPSSRESTAELDQLSTVQLIERFQQQTVTLVKSEIREALGEVKTKGTRAGIDLGVSGVGLLLILFGLGSFTAAAIAGLANVVSLWLAAVIVGAILLVVGGVAAAVGAVRAKAQVPPIPQHTADSVAQDITTIKEHL